MKKTVWIAVVLAFITIPVVFGVVRKDHTMDRVLVDRMHTSPDSHFLTLNGQQVHYVDVGHGDETILAIHGLGGFAYNFELMFDELGDDYRIVAVDLPGFGMSDFPPVTDTTDLLGMYRTFLTDFVDTVGLDTFHVVGNSLGGWMSWELAATIPERVETVTLLASAGYDVEKLRNHLIGILKIPLMKRAVRKGVPPAFKDLVLRRIFYDDSFARDERAQVWVDFMNRDGTIETMLTMAESDVVADTTRIASLPMPVLIIWGENDKIIPVEHADRFERDIARDSLIIYPACGHAPMIENAEQCADDIHSFIQTAF